MNIRINKILLALLSLLLLAATAISFASCNKEDDKDNDKAKGNNDLAAFQSMFVEIDASCNFVGRYNGVPLYESDTAHLYFPVEDIKEAGLKYFNKVTFMQKDAWPLNDGLPRWLEKILDSMY
jgi:hypothetical protein